MRRTISEFRLCETRRRLETEFGRSNNIPESVGVLIDVGFPETCEVGSGGLEKE